MLSCIRIVKELLFEAVGILDIMQNTNLSNVIKSASKDSSQLAFDTISKSFSGH